MKLLKKIITKTIWTLSLKKARKKEIYSLFF